MTTRLVLASASPSRLRILHQAGVDPEVLPSGVDEDAVVAALPAGTRPVRVVEGLARAKVEDVLARAGDELLGGADRVVFVGCDSMLLVDDHLEGKPHTAERARGRWRAMRGRHGVLLTGHAVVVVDSAGPAEAYRAAGTSDTTVHFGAPTDAEIDAYVATGEPLEVAGAFTLESLGGWFIDRIEGDPSSVIGLSLPLLRELLAGAGVAVHDLWRDGLAPGAAP